MLLKTFCHAPGIGPKTERQLWQRGVLSWDEALRAQALPLPAAKAGVLKKELEVSAARLADRDAAYFAQRLAAEHAWRLFGEFRDSVAYLDIETTGMGGPDDYITAIGLYDGRSFRQFVYDDNLVAFRDEIEQYRLLVTYNGKCFDLPFIREFLGLPMGQAHIDLRYALARLGYRGGLKGCERQLGLDRGDLAGLDGFFAVRLWFEFLNNGNRRALETMLAYNAADVLNLQTLMVFAYNRMLDQTPFAEECRLPEPEPAANPWEPDLETIQRIRWEAGI